jgi:hypothetical protein
MVTYREITAEFEYQDQCHSVVLKNISTLGSHFYTIEGNDIPDILPGNAIDLRIYTPEGMGTMAGVIRWIRTMGAWYSMGIEFAYITPSLQEHLLQIQENQF